MKGGVHIIIYIYIYIMKTKYIKTFELFNTNESMDTIDNLAKIMIGSTAGLTALGAVYLGFHINDLYYVDNHIIKGEKIENGNIKYSNINVNIIKNNNLILNTYYERSGKTSNSRRVVTILDPNIKTIWINTEFFGGASISDKEVPNSTRIDLSKLDIDVKEPGYTIYNTYWGAGIHKIMIITGVTDKIEKLEYPMTLDNKPYAVLIKDRYRFIVPIIETQENTDN